MQFELTPEQTASLAKAIAHAQIEAPFTYIAEKTANWTDEQKLELKPLDPIEKQLSTFHQIRSRVEGQNIRAAELAARDKARLEASLANAAEKRAQLEKQDVLRYNSELAAYNLAKANAENGGRTFTAPLPDKPRSGEELERGQYRGAYQM